MQQIAVWFYRLLASSTRLQTARCLPAHTQPGRVLGIGLLCGAALLAGCDALSPAPTATPPATLTPASTATTPPTATITSTPTQTQTPSSTPTATPLPTDTATPTATSTASVTPDPSVGFVSDNWELLTLPGAYGSGSPVTSPVIVFTNSNNQESIQNLSTASPETNREILYFVDAATGRREQILEFDSSTEDRVYLNPGGTNFAYFISRGASSGLYIVNMSRGFKRRIIATTTLIQRGIASEPVWSPDGEALALALNTGYDLDVFIYTDGGEVRRLLVGDGSYDFYPVWSPDGRRIAFISDRATCPSWRPGEPGFCDVLNQPTPVGGQLYVVDVQTQQVEQVSDVYVTEPPRWVSDDIIVFAEGDQSDILNPQRRLWQADLSSGRTRNVAVAADDDALYLSDVWSPDGTRVLVQRVTQAGSVVLLMSVDGQILVDYGDDLNFPRFVMSGDWSPTGEVAAVGGLGEQCPFGIRVLGGNTGDFVAQGGTPPSMCNPQFSADGQWLVFSGIDPRIDGRVDIYRASSNGFNARNLTADLKGSNKLIGWFGGAPPADGG